MFSSPKASSPKSTKALNLSPLVTANLKFLSMTSLTSHTESTSGEDDLAPPLDLPSVQLEALADAFQEQLLQMGKVQDRSFRSRTVPKCFQGKDVVDALMRLMQDQSSGFFHLSQALGETDSSTVTRAQALQVGRNIQKEFQFFVHTKDTKSKHYPLQDTETDLYQFDHNLPMQVFTQRRQYPSMWDKVTLLENRVPLGDHRGLLTVHPDTFLAKEAVDVLMDLKLVKSRGEAVHLMKKMNEKVHCCRMADHPGNDGTNFEDNTSVWRFVPPSERIPREHHHHHKSHKERSKSPKSKTTKSKSPLRRTKTEGDRGRSVSPAKDAAYFQDRAAGLRSRLDVYRQERAAANNQATAETSN